MNKRSILKNFGINIDNYSNNLTNEEWKEHDDREALRIAEEAKQRRIANDIKYRQQKYALEEQFAREPTWREEIGLK